VRKQCTPNVRPRPSQGFNEVYVPLLLEDEDGTAQGNDWARGFMRGMGMRHDGWAELVNDEEHGGWLSRLLSELAQMTE